MTIFTFIFFSMLFSIEKSPEQTHRFSLIAPYAEHVKLVIFNRVEDEFGNEYVMEKNNDEFFIELPNIKNGTLYGFKVKNTDSKSQEFDAETIITDPYSKAMATQNHYAPINKSIVIKNNFNWENGGKPTWVNIPWEDLIIYEAHLKDLSAHHSSQSQNRGTYLGVIDENQRGGINHIKEMGYNAVEFLPIFEFGNVEIPYLDSSQVVVNTWNPYAANHWGYMPSSFFAPEGNFASNSKLDPLSWNGVDGRQINEFKYVVKKFHEEGIAVILDVVYNHVSQYDFHPLKHLQKNKFFRQNELGDYSSISGCGNDLKTENEYIRQLIIDSVIYWMEEYHIDGFRFDLGKLIDWETVEAVREAAIKVNPHVFITCEPWGGGYDPNGFSDRGWSSWNDQFRNAFKGWHPDGNGGFIFGKWHNDYGFDKIQRMFQGSPRSHGGQYTDIAHSVNYLESHDDHTLGDFIKLEMGLFHHDDIIHDIDSHAVLTPMELKLHKIAAMSLLTSQGSVMISQGQEWGRSKVIAPTNIPDKNIGKLDHNSYEKDNETNWLNWNHKDKNIELVNFYKSLINIRKENSLLRHAKPHQFEFIKPTGSNVAIGFIISGKSENIIVLLNSHQRDDAQFELNKSDVSILISTQENIHITETTINLPPISGVILKHEK